MSVNMANELAALGRMTVKELREKHIEVFGEATRSNNKDYLRKRIAWRIQANAYGYQSEQARQPAFSPSPSYLGKPTLMRRTFGSCSSFWIKSCIPTSWRIRASKVTSILFSATALL